MIFGCDDGRPPLPEALELVAVYTGHAAAAIDASALLAEVTRRNRTLETLRGCWRRWPARSTFGGGPAAPLLALRAPGRDAVALHGPSRDGATRHGACLPRRTRPGEDRPPRRWQPRAVLRPPARTDRARLVVGDSQSPHRDARRDGGSSRRGGPTHGLGDDALDVLDDAARSIRLAIERDALLGSRTRKPRPCGAHAAPTGLPVETATSCARR